MHPKSPKWLNDILEACDFIQKSTGSRTVADYEHDRLFRSAIERNFEIIGEALNRIQKVDPETAARIPEHSAIISFRNLLIHGYDIVGYSQVWHIVQSDVPNLRAKVVALLKVE